jgi:hypothetical protein
MDGRMLAENYDGMMIVIEQAFKSHKEHVLAKYNGLEEGSYHILFELESVENTINYDLEQMFKRTT